MEIEIVRVDLYHPVSILRGVWAEFKCSLVSGMAIVVPTQGYERNLDLNLLSGKCLSVETSQEGISDFRILTLPEKQEPSIKTLPRLGDYEICGLVSSSSSDGFIDVRVSDLSFILDIEETQGVKPQEGQWVFFLLHGLSFYDDGNYCWYKSSSHVQAHRFADSYRESQRIQKRDVQSTSFNISFTPTIKKLHFNSGGTILFHSVWKNSKVAIWDINHHKLFNICPGLFVGFSNDSKTFLTNHDQIKAWETHTGTELPLQKIDPDHYSFHQRVVVFTNRDKTKFQIRDVFGIYPPQELDVPSAPDSFLENWAMAPNNKNIAVIYGGSAGGFDWSAGACFDLISGKPVFEFKVGKDDYPPSVISFSTEHNLLLSGDRREFRLYDLTGVEPVREIRLSNQHPQNPYGWGGDIVTVNPHNKWLIAANLGLTHIQIVNIQQSNQGIVERVIQEPSKIIDLEFHPDGVHLASSLHTGEVHLWNIKVGKMVANLSS